MPRAWSLGQLKERSRTLADMVNSTFVSDDELRNFINSALTEVYDTLVQAGPPDYYASTQPYTTTPNVIQYALPGDFRNATTLYAVEVGDKRRPIQLINDYQRSHYWSPKGAYSLELEYMAAPPILSMDSDTFDGVSGWEELIVATAARDMLLKEESDTSGVEAKIMQLRGRIRTASSQRGGSPRYITNVYDQNPSCFGNECRITGFRIRAGVIEFYEPINNLGGQ